MKMNEKTKQKVRHSTIFFLTLNLFFFLFFPDIFSLLAQVDFSDENKLKTTVMLCNHSFRVDIAFGIRIKFQVYTERRNEKKNVL